MSPGITSHSETTALPSSYQHESVDHHKQTDQDDNSTTSSRATARPIIRHYYDEADNNSTDPRSFFVVRGDASLRPNTGETNSYDTAIFGLALHELLEKLRLANMVAAVASIASLLVNWFLQLITAQFSQLVLSCYLAFLAGVLLLVEATSLYHMAAVDQFLKDNFGLLRRPVGKAIYIYVLATICGGIGGITGYILAALYFASASLLLYAWYFYEEMRRPFEQEDEQAESGDSTGRQRTDRSSERSSSWSAYASSFSSSFVKVSSETAALLGRDSS